MNSIHSKDIVNSFCPTPCELQGAPNGLLSHLNYGLKDIFDVVDCPTGFGSPAWLKSHLPAKAHAHVVQVLQKAGANLVGKTWCDELTYSLFGMNAHYGTPINSAAPDRVPGGSSNGSVAAVAAGIVDFSIGSDTGGSVRAPSSFCGVWGIRPTHGAVSLLGARPLAKSFDTCGWFTKSPSLLLKIGQVLLPKHISITQPSNKYLFLKEAFDLIPEPLSNILQNDFLKWAGSSQIDTVSIAPHTLNNWADVFRTIQAGEVWQEHGQWVSDHSEELGSVLKGRFEYAKSLPAADFEAAKKNRLTIQKFLYEELADGKIFVVPTVGGIAPLLNTPAAELEEFRKLCFMMLCIAGIGGLPQVHLPLSSYLGAPIGVSIIGGPNRDLDLLELVSK